MRQGSFVVVDGVRTHYFESGQGKPENTALKPHQGFILDGLLR